ncbi:P-loop containing nucleoside triphosphate hydrolase protein [Lophiotrema nucula]|uniref:P-loop containing nucleoside triphosphate hydrolase protein n=1 Tax=Lophiotrema nucula TaxID=690887 RepID=A0A6A5Z591_9PLEO|nr:P-loop containing nucleoside triphosphate hydrolase protein [Lophiotrema nucula]
MSSKEGSVSSLVYGADEFVYVLGKCLINYGGAIGNGLYQSAVSVSQQTIRVSRDTTPGKQGCKNSGGQGANTARHQEPAQEDVPVYTAQESPFETPRPEPKASHTEDADPKRAKMDWSKWNMTGSTKDQQQSESDKQEFQLREQIRSMKVDFQEDESVLDMANVAGLDSVKLALDEFACFFLHFPHLTRKLRQRSTTGILLFGPQGTGKTLLIKSFAKKYNLAVYDIRASAIMSKFVGESEKFIRTLFKEVRSNSPSILLLDECDGLLCNPAADATQSHNYRLLQNEMKNQWSDLMYSRDEVIVIGVTNKPHDIDMDGFGRRLSLKLHVGLPNRQGCQSILRGALERVRSQLQEQDFAKLGTLCCERGLSGYDIDCMVEGMLRKALRGITVATFFKPMRWGDDTLIVPCQGSDEGAVEGPWSHVGGNPEDLSYVPFTAGEVREAICRLRATVDEAMMQKHILFASQYGTDD